MGQGLAQLYNPGGKLFVAAGLVLLMTNFTLSIGFGICS